MRVTFSPSGANIGNEAPSGCRFAVCLSTPTWVPSMDSIFPSLTRIALFFAKFLVVANENGILCLFSSEYPAYEATFIA